MKHLITGANGFSGRHLLPVLREREADEVTSVDLFAAPGVEPCDLTDEAAVRGLLEKVRPDRIYHLVGTFANDWGKDYAANVESARVLMEAVRALSLPCRILLVGSAAEYGEVPPGPVAETTPLRPVSIYGLTKVMQTELMGFYQRRFGLPVLMARPFNLYGKGCSPALFPGHVEREIAKVKSGEQDKIRVRRLTSERDYLPVTDAVRAYCRILEHGEAGEVYHVGSGQPVRMSDFLVQLLAPHGLTLDDVEIQPTPEGAKPDVPCVFADIRKLAALPV